MIDYLVKFANEAAAIADPIVSAYRADDSWRGDCCIPGATVTQISTGIVLPYWYITISTETPDLALLDHPACVLAVDWDAMQILRAIVPSGTSPADFQVSPVYAGRDPAALLADVGT